MSQNSTPEATPQNPVATTTAPPQPPQPMYIPYTPVGPSETAEPSRATDIGYFPRMADLGTNSNTNNSNTNNSDNNGQAASTPEQRANPLATFTRERQPELPILPLMEMVDGNESRQILEIRVRLVEREFRSLMTALVAHVLKSSSAVCLGVLLELTGTNAMPSEPYMDNVPTPAASTTFTNNPSSSDLHHQDRRARLQSLPSTVLNPLGLLAEASLRGSDEPPSEAPTPRDSPPLPGTNSHSGNHDYGTPGHRQPHVRINRHLPGVGNAKYFEVRPTVCSLSLVET